MRALAIALVLSAGATACPPPPPPAAPAAPVRDPALTLIEATPDLDRAVVGPAPAGAPGTVAILFASWCGPCRQTLAALDRALAAVPGARVVGINYRPHEEYSGWGDAAAVRAYIAANAPWLRVVPADEPLFVALGRPPKVPTIFVYDRAGALVTKFDRREREPPDEVELTAVLRELAARDQRLPR